MSLSPSRCEATSADGDDGELSEAAADLSDDSGDVSVGSDDNRA
jgi:hypothetical protein